MRTQRTLREVRKVTIMALCFAASILLLAGSAAAQGTATGALSGSVSDNQGGRIKGATVTATNKATGLERTAAANDSGEYRIDFLPAGRYDVKISASGFGDATSQDLELLVGKTTTLDVSMNPGVQTASVTVTGEAELVNREKTDISINVTPRDVQDLPLNGRDLGNLAYLAPGAKPVDSYDPTKNRIAIFGVNGSSGRNVNVTVNGIDNKDNTVGGPVMQFPLEAIQEFIISTQRFSAVNGRSEGAAVNVVTKSGGSKFHGSTFFFLRDKKLNAAAVNNPATGAKESPKPPFNRKQFGGSIGGPINKGDHPSFFFFAWERQKEAVSIPVFPDALAELNLVTSLGAKPSPIIPLPYRDTRWNARIDHTFSPKEQIFASFSDQFNIGLNDQSGQRNDLTEGNFTTNKLQLGNITLTSQLSSNVVNAATVGYQYWHNLIDTDNKVPLFTFPTGISFGTNANVPQESYQSKYQFKDDISITHGVHTFRTGIDYLYEPKLGGFFEFNPTLEIDFNKKPSEINALPAKFATAGIVGGMTIAVGDPYFNLPGGAKMLGLYFQDDWKFRHNLTLNLGLRWDKDFNLIGGSAQAQNRTYLAMKAIGHPSAAKLPQDDNKDFSPRVGFAWDIGGTGKHVIRGGYGLYFGQTFLNIPLFMIQQARPVIFQTAFSISKNGTDVVPGTGIILDNWRFGIDPLPTIPPPSTKPVAGATGRIMDPDYRNPYTQQVNIGYAWQFNSYSVLEVDYTHVLALHESKTININPTRKMFCANGGKSCGVGSTDPNGQEISSRPLAAALSAAGQVAFGRVDLEASVGRARYDGLNISYRRRLHNHFTINATYTFSKGVAYNGNAAAFRNRAWDPFNYFASYEFGPVPNDTAHRFSASGVINLPWGIQVAPIVQAESARAYTAGYGGSVDVLGSGSGRGTSHVTVFTASPNDLTATLTAFGDPAGTFLLNPADPNSEKVSNSVKYRNCLRAGQCTFAPFDNLRGQPYFQLDTRVSKNFRFKERYVLTGLIQFFDLTNRANFGNNFSGDVRSTSYRQALGFITPSGVIVPHALSAELGIKFTF